MRESKYFWFVLVLLLASAPNCLSQLPPKFPLTTKSDQKVLQAVKESIGKRGEIENEIKSIVPKYAAMKGEAEAHPLSCDRASGNEDNRTEERWKFDSRVAMFGEPTGSSGQLTERFLSCFEADKEDDKIACPMVGCIPVLGTTPPLEICFDPPPACGGNCCANNSEMLQMGRLPMPLAAGYANPVTSPLAFAALMPFVFSEGCNLDPRKHNNRGYNLNFWWPENEVEIQNYERTVFNPTYECGNTQPPKSFKHDDLTRFLKTVRASLTKFQSGGGIAGEVSYDENEAGVSKLRFDPNIGESHWAGLLPGDQTFTAEAHVYRTYNDVLTSLNFPGGDGTLLGYKRDCRCFYSGLQDQRTEGKFRKTVNGWTEQNKFLPYWRYWQNSKPISEHRYEALAKFGSYDPDSCAFLRAYDDFKNKPPFENTGYQDLYKALSPVNAGPPPNDPIRLRKELERICYRGGGDLMPITGQLIGHFSPLPASAYIARRALLLFGTKELKLNDKVVDREFVDRDRRINRYSDKNDKMQRIYPLDKKNSMRASHCFRGHDIPNYLTEATEDWPRDLMRDALTDGGAGPMDTPRFLHWNKRGSCMCPYIGKASGLRIVGTDTWLACTPVGAACHKRGAEDQGDYEDDPKAPLQGRGGGTAYPLPDGIPHPFLPEMQRGIYTADPIFPDDPATCQIEGGNCRSVRPGKCELTVKRNGMHLRQPEDFEDIQGDINKGGIQCKNPIAEPRCSGGIKSPTPSGGGTTIVGGSGGGAVGGGGGGASNSGGNASSEESKPDITCEQLREIEQTECQKALGDYYAGNDRDLRLLGSTPSNTPGTLYSGWKRDSNGVPIQDVYCGYSNNRIAKSCGTLKANDWCPEGNLQNGCLIPESEATNREN
jgi:hypothetical protein